MPSVLQVFDKQGYRLAELDVTPTRSWVLNAYGRAEFTISTAHPKCTLENLEFGNFVVIYHDTLPVWGGIIDTPRRWRRGSVIISAYSGEYILTLRRGPHNLTYSGTAGELFEQFIRLASSQYVTPIRIGSVYMGGIRRQETCNHTSMYEEIRRVTGRANLDWDVEPIVSPHGQLLFYANLYERKGVRRVFQLTEGDNLKESVTPLEENGPIINDMAGIGEGISWTSRKYAIRVDEESIQRFGAHQGVTFLDGNTVQTTIDKNTEEALNLKKFPRQVMTLTALDRGETFKEVRLGDTYDVRLWSVGFTPSGFGSVSTARIIGMSFADEDLELKTEAETGSIGGYE